MNPTRGIIFKISALALFAVMASLIKAASANVPSWEAAFFRNFFGMLIIVGWMLRRGELRGGIRTTNPMGHFWRGIIGTSAMMMGFAALGLLPLPEVTAIGFASPLLTVLFAVMFLGERIRIFRLSAVFFGLIGVGIIMRPRLTLIDGGGAETILLIGALLALGSAALRSLAQIHIRRLVRTEQTSAIVFYFSLTGTILSLLTIPFGWVIPSTTDLLYLVTAGLVGGIAQILLTTGYRYAEASLLAPFDYVSMIYATVIGFFIFSEIPTSATLTGSAIVIAAGIAIILRERKLGLKRGKARPSGPNQP
jgi:drug/metabolite transporter (DMT)-like permease